MPGSTRTVGIGEAVGDDACGGTGPCTVQARQQIMPSRRDGESAVTVLAQPGHGQPQLPVSRRSMPAPGARSLDLMVH